MTVDEMVEALQRMQALGYGDRIVSQFGGAQLDPTDTREITGVFADDDDDEVVLETVEWMRVG
jgi:hypothetical protein